MQVDFVRVGKRRVKVIQAHLQLFVIGVGSHHLHIALAHGHRHFPLAEKRPAHFRALRQNFFYPLGKCGIISIRAAEAGRCKIDDGFVLKRFEKLGNCRSAHPLIGPRADEIQIRFYIPFRRTEIHDLGPRVFHFFPNCVCKHLSVAGYALIHNGDCHKMTSFLKK